MPDWEPSAPPRGRILVADDEPHIRRILATFLEASGDLLTTGPTGTNVMDLMIALRLPAQR